MNVVLPGPTPLFSVEQVIHALRDSAGVRSIAAMKLGCDRTTVSNYIADYPAIADALAEIEETNNDMAEAQLLQALQQGAPWAVCFRLKTQARDRGYAEHPGWAARDEASASAATASLPGGSNLRVIPIEKLRELEAEYRVANAG